jgi:predicted RNA-binding protein YlqC (UPF0109 family)
MDEKWRSGQRNGRKPFKKGLGFNRRPTKVSDSTAAEDLAEYVLQVLAREPESIVVTRHSEGGGRVKISVACDPGVTGRLIGKGGKTISALRQVVRTIAMPRGKRIDIELNDIESGVPSHVDVL